MSFQSSPTLPRRKYGSVEQDDVAKATPVLSFNHLRENGTERGEQPSGRRWFSFAVVGTLAVGVMVALAQAGDHLPPPTTTLETAPTESMMEASGIARSSGSGSVEVNDTPANVKVHHSWPGVATELAPLSFEATNFYHIRDGKPALDYPWLKEVKLIEPHRETTFTVSSPRDGFEYRWTVRGADADKDDVRAEASGDETVMILTVLDDTMIDLEEVNTETGVVVRRLEEKVMVKYVRRELRTLTDEEREELFDAMYTLWTVRVDGGNGKELYGDDYADIYAINRLHYKASSPLDCDHFHDGLGFMTNHAVITNTFEYSLQRVNPKLTVPYWDFTIDGSSAGGIFGESVSSAETYSKVFTPEWFGTYDEEDNMLKDSRWAFTPIPQMEVNNPGELTPDIYLKLRAPWNVNDRAYLTRGMGNMCGIPTSNTYPWPTCETHYDLATSYTDFYSYVWDSLYDPHGPVHIWIGGVLDCEQSYATIRTLVGEEAAGELAMFSFVHRKNLYREGIFQCSGTASIDQKPEEILSTGQCGCLGYDLTQGNDYEDIYDRLTMADSILGDVDDDVKREVTSIICSTPANDGDHLQASSSLDPSFWPTHPTMERLWMYSILTGHITDFTWPDDDVTVTKPDGTVEVESISLYGETCTGHRGSDVFPFGLLDSDTDGFTIKTGIRGNLDTGNQLTNREALQAFDARSNSLPYVYDTFKWTHCEADGVNFDDAWENAKARGPSSIKSRPAFKEGEVRRPRYSGYEEIKANAQARKANAKGQAAAP
ncbi:unnamed protein product [Ectocarpus sp. 6 AP-2014]